MNFTMKRVTDNEDLEEVTKLLAVVWGEVSIIPVAHLIAVNHNGGIVIAAFEEESNKIVGFCYGFAGVDEHQKPYIYSNMLAIHPDYRDAGIGRQLKLAQKEWAIAYGYDVMKWTFDPLEIRNGYLNVGKLGGTVRTYIPEFYGAMKDKVNKGLLSDRLLLEWELRSDGLQKVVDVESRKTYRPILDWTESNGFPVPEDCGEIHHEPGYLVAVPKDIQSIKEADLDLLMAWRLAVREALMSAFDVGYVLVDVKRKDDLAHYYVLEKMIGEI